MKATSCMLMRGTLAAALLACATAFWSNLAVANQALTLDGVDDYVDIPDHADFDTNITSTSGLTVEAWYKTSAATLSDNALVFKWGTESSYALHFISGGGIRFVLVDGTTGLSATSGSAFNDGVWHHVAGTWSGDTARIYIDGTELGSDTNVSFGEVTDSSVPLRIGYGSSAGESGYFPGDVDEVRIWNKALSASEIVATSHKIVTPASESNLVGYWRL